MLGFIAQVCYNHGEIRWPGAAVTAPTLSQDGVSVVTAPSVVPSPDSDNLKRCTKCGEWKPRDQFGKHKLTKDGLRPECKPCRVEYSRQWRAENAEWSREYYRWYRRNRGMVAGVDTASTDNSTRPHRLRKSRQVDCTCPVCGTHFSISPAYAKRSKTNCCSKACRGALYSQEARAERPRRVCAGCGNEFTYHPSHAGRNQRFCSLACRQQHARRLRMARCETCDREFEKRPGQKYCSLRCRPAPNKAEPITHTCLTCGKAFDVKPATHRAGQGQYCSRQCFGAGKVKAMQGKDYSRARGGKRDDLDGQYFRSTWEANYARYLNWLVTQGTIASWDYECQTFVFHGVTRGVVSYTPDFKVVETDGSYEWHEVKGWMDDKSKAKLKRMAKYYPNEKVIVIGKDEYRAIKKWSGVIPNWEHTPGH